MHLEGKISKILLLGGSGLLGAALLRHFEKEGLAVVAPRSQELDLRQFHALREAAKEISPDLVLNAAAQSSVDEAEKHPEQAFAVNALGAQHAALVAAELDLPLVHLSSDYVFDGSRREPSCEYHPTGVAPNHYGRSKLQGELLVRQTWPRHFIVRVAALFGAGGRPDFADWVLANADPRHPLRIVSDRFMSPTWTDALARQLTTLFGTPFYGTYHAVGHGAASWYELARTALDLTDRDPGGVVPILDHELPSVARRASFTVLDNHLLRLRGLDLMPPWREALKTRLQEQMTVDPIRRDR